MYSVRSLRIRMQEIQNTCGLSLIYTVDLRLDKSLVFIRVVLSLVTALLCVLEGFYWPP